MSPRLAASLRWLFFAIATGFASSAGAENRILIPVKINNQTVRFVFDTGASEAFLFRSTADRLGLKITPPPADVKINPGEVMFSQSEPVTFEVVGHVFPSTPLAVIENPPQPVDFDGAVGWPNLRKSSMYFDGPTLSFQPLNALSPETASWTKLTERADWKILSLELPVRIVGQPAYLGIDTGNPDGVFLAPNAWAKWRAAHSGNPTTLVAYFMPGAGLVVTEAIWTDEIDLQGIMLRGVPVSCMNAAEVALLPPSSVAVIGLAALRRLNLIFDGSGGVYVKPLATPPPAYVHNKIGAVFMPAGPGNDTLVAQVVRNSPAGKAGVRDGDVLLKIDQLDVTHWRTQPGILPLSRFWQQRSGTKLRLTLQRNGTTFTAEIVLRNILGPEDISL
jgi:hypothetical protein